MTVSVTIMNQKGGVGKTTTVLMLAQCLAHNGKRVLCLDLDPQDGNLSSRLRADKTNLCGTLEVFEEPGIQPEDVVQTSQVEDDIAVDVIAASRGLQKFAASQPSVDAYFMLQEFLGRLAPNTYDVVLIDTPPALNNLTINALCASDLVLIPSKAEESSIEGIVEMSNSINKVRTRFNPKLDVLGIVVTYYRGNTLVQRECRDGIGRIAEKIGCDVFDGTVRNSVVIQEAQQAHAPIYAYKTTTGAVQDCLAVANEFERRVARKTGANGVADASMRQ